MAAIASYDLRRRWNRHVASYVKANQSMLRCHGRSTDMRRDMFVVGSQTIAVWGAGFTFSLAPKHLAWRATCGVKVQILAIGEVSTFPIHSPNFLGPLENYSDDCCYLHGGVPMVGPDCSGRPRWSWSIGRMWMLFMKS